MTSFIHCPFLLLFLFLMLPPKTTPSYNYWNAPPMSQLDKQVLYSAKVLATDLANILDNDWKRLDRILRDSDNWANAVSTHTDLDNMKTVLLESAERLTEYFSSFADSVYKSATAVEAHAETFVFDGQTVTELQDLDESLLNYDFKRQSNVTFQNTSSHLPVEIWNGSDIMQFDLAWSFGMNEIFADTLRENENIYWSYFGTPLGLLRVYPGTPLNMPTMYDVRLDHWYIQTSTPPKHMLIAIDASGSVFGLVLELMKNTAAQLLDSLNDNDFVSIIGFHETPFPLKSCLGQSKDLEWKSTNNFIRATNRNKLALKQLMQTSLVAENIANFENMFTYSYSLFRNLTEEDTFVPICSKVLMVITDGGDGEAKDAYSKINEQVLESVRIFTYVEGSAVYDDDSLSWIACRNKGFFHKVPTNEAVRMQAMEYLQVLSRPMALNYHKMLFFSAPEIQYWNRNLGHALAATYPVYRRVYRDSLDDHLPHFLGVIGLDIPLFEIGQRIPSAGLSHDGQVLMINAKGHVVYHSTFALLSELGLSYTPPVDISEILHLTDIDYEWLKRRMLQMDVGKVNMEVVDATFHVERYAYQMTSELIYTRIDVESSSFVLILLMPETDLGTFGPKKVESVASNIFTWQKPYRMCNKICQSNLAQAVPKLSPGSSLANATCDQSQFFCGRIFVAPLPYCPNLLKFSSKSSTEMLIGLKYLLSNDENEQDCLVHDDAQYHYGNSLLQEVKLVLEEIIQIFKVLDPLASNELDRFIITTSGISVILNNKYDLSWWEKVRNPLNSPIFRKHLAISRLVADGADFLIFTTSYKFKVKQTVFSIEPLPNCFGISGLASNSESPIPIATKLITRGDSYSKESSRVPLGVLGKVLDETYFYNLFRGPNHASLCSSADSTMHCYLLDDGAFIIAESSPFPRENQTGRSLFALEQCLMAELVNQEIFNQIVFENNLCTCPSRAQSATKSSSRTFSRSSILHLALKSLNVVTSFFFYFLNPDISVISALSGSVWTALSSPVSIVSVLWTAFLDVRIVDAQDYDHPRGIPSPCTVEEYKFTAGRNFFSDMTSPISGTLNTCKDWTTGTVYNCSTDHALRTYSISWVRNTNLQLLVVSESMSVDWCVHGFIIPRALQYPRKEYDICEQPNYHREPPNMTCPADHHLENDVYKHCGSSTQHKSLSTTALALAPLLLFYFSSLC